MKEFMKSTSPFKRVYMPSGKSISIKNQEESVFSETFVKKKVMGVGDLFHLPKVVEDQFIKEEKKEEKLLLHKENEEKKAIEKKLKQLEYKLSDSNNLIKKLTLMTDTKQARTRSLSPMTEKKTHKKETKPQTKLTFREMGSNLSLETLIDEIRTKEDNKIIQTLKILRRNRLAEDQFHKEALNNVKMFQDHRVNIEKNFEVLKNQTNLLGYELVSKLGKILQIHCPCLRGDCRSCKMEPETQLTNTLNSSPIVDKMVDATESHSNRKFKRTLFGSREKIDVALDFRGGGNTKIIPFLIEKEKLQNDSMDLIKEGVHEKPNSDLLPGDSSVLISLIINKPETPNQKILGTLKVNGLPIELIVDWDAEQKFEFELETKQLKKVKVPSDENGNIAKREIVQNLLKEGKTIECKKDNIATASELDLKKEMLDLFSRVNNQKLDKELCRDCTEKKNLMIGLISEISVIDCSILKEIDNIQNYFKEINSPDSLLDAIKIVRSLNVFSESFRNCLKTCFSVLPNHAIFFEKLFKIILILNEVQANRLNESITQTSYELQEYRMCTDESLGLKRQYILACELRDQYLEEIERLKEYISSKERALQEEIDLLSHKLDEILSSDAMLLSNMKLQKLDIENEVLQFLCEKYFLNKDKEVILRKFLKKPNLLDLNMFNREVVDNSMQTEKRVEGKFNILEYWRVPFNELLKYNWRINQNKEIQNLKLKAENYVMYIKEALAYFAERHANENFITPRFSLVERNLSKFHQVLMEYLMEKEQLTNAISAQYLVTKLGQNTINRFRISFRNSISENQECSSVLLFTKFLREDLKDVGEKPIEVRPIKDQRIITIKNLEEIFAKLFMQLISMHKNSSPVAEESMPYFKNYERLLPLRDAIDYFFSVFDLSQGKDLFPNFIKKLLKQNIVDPFNKPFSKKEKFLSLLAAQISFKYSFSNLSTLQYLSKILKRIMSKEHMSISEDLVNSDLKNFQIKEKGYFISNGEDFSKEKHLPSRLNKANKLLKSYHKNVVKTKYEEESDFVFLKEINDYKLGELFNCLQIFANLREHFGIENDIMNINSFLLREIAGPDAILTSKDLMNTLKPFLLKPENYCVSILDFTSLICELVSEKFDAFLAKRDQLFKQYALIFKGGLEKTKISEIIKYFDFKGLLEENEVSYIKVSAFIYEIEMAKISKAILTESNPKEQIKIFEAILNNGAIYFSLKDIEPILSYENLIHIYKRSLLKLETKAKARIKTEYTNI